MKKSAYLLLAVILCFSLLPEPAAAQRGGRGGRDRGGRDRGGDRGDRGGSTSGRPSWGGDRGGRSFGGGDRGSRGGSTSGRPSWGGNSGGPRPDFNPQDIGKRIAGYMDRNRDGYIDSGEFGRLPQSMQDRISQSGVDIRRGMSVADYGKRTSEFIQKRIEERSRGESSRGGRRSYDRSSSGEKTSTGKTIFKQSERQKMLMELPSEYTEGDADKDGQIALFEWAAWKRNDMFAFFDLDSNNDGFLTARELSRGESDSERGIVAKRDRVAIAGVNAGGSRVRSNNSPNARSTKPGAGSRSPEQLQKDKGRAKYYFGALDRDKNGTISEEEWNRSRSIKGMFDRAGIKDKTFTESAFTKNYLKVTEKGSSGSSRGSNSGSSSGGRPSWGGDRGGSSGGTSGRPSWGGDRGGSSRDSGRSNWGGDRGSSDRGRGGRGR